jgi:hypothetical protein
MCHLEDQFAYQYLATTGAAAPQLKW